MPVPTLPEKMKHRIAQMALLAVLAELCPWQMSIPTPLMIYIGVSVMPGHRFSSFAICSFKNQDTVEKKMWKKLLQLQAPVLQSLGCLPNLALIFLCVMMQFLITHLITFFASYLPHSSIRQACWGR